MLLTLHAATGAMLGEFASTPAAAFGLGFLSHFVLDMFPHGDRMIAHDTKATGNGKRYYWLVGIDAFAALAIFFPAFALGRFDHPWLAYLGLLGGLLPDLIVAIPEYALYIKKEYRVRLRWFYAFHVYVHDQLIRVFDGMPLKIGIAFQVILLALMWRLWR
ncbi:MAG: hypothetical protein Q7S02_06150 [bacterium]|nr:hypothetical protein [bacterium]